MTIRHLRIFKTVCECESMTLTAEKLFMTQPAISQAIKELEQHYGTILLDRFPKKLYITDSGKKLYSYAAHIIDLFDEAEQSLNTSETYGGLRIGANLTIGTTMIHKYIKKFKEDFPNVDIKVWVKNSKTLSSLILQNELDFALIEDRFDSTFFVNKVFCDDRITIATSPQHPLVNKNDITLSDLVNEPFLLREKGSGVRDAFDAILSINNITANVIWESSSTRALVNATANNFGITVLPYMLVKDYLDDGIVSEIKVKDINLSRKLNVVYHKNKLLSNIANRFIEIVMDIEK